MKKTVMSGMILVISIAMMMTACKKEQSNNDDDTDNGRYNNQQYPSTAHVIRRAVTDVDGNCYDAVQIGNQVWMAENLRTTKYADGTTFPVSSIHGSSNTPLRYLPNVDENEVPIYGYLYNWTAVMHGSSSSTANPSGVQGICPNGWHVPSDAEWTQLATYVGSQSEYVCNSSSSNIAKALASTVWPNDEYEIHECAICYNSSTNNATGFSALPAGYYTYTGYYNNIYSYCPIGFFAGFWSTTENDYGSGAYMTGFFMDDEQLGSGYDNKSVAYSVRCVRD